jgi:hypothetical protein
VPARILALCTLAFALVLSGCTNSMPASGSDPATGISVASVKQAKPIVRLASRTDSYGPIRHYPPKPPRANGRPPPNKRLPGREGSVESLAPDPTLQEAAPGPSAPTPGAGFNGVGNVNFVLPPDTVGDVGPNHYVQMVNLSFAVYSKTGTLLYGPADNSTLWDGFGGPCETINDGDPIVLYDQWADRWLLSQFALPNYPNGPFYQCIAISQTGDPTGAYYRYEFLISNTKMNDYPKFGVWPDGYYMSMNQFTQSGSWGGQGAVVFQRDKMLLGQAALMVYFDLYGVDPNLGGMLPSDWDGVTPPPSGSPNYFVEVDDDAWGYSPDQLQVWKFQVNWTNPGSSTMTFSQALTVSAFNSNMCNYARNCIPQRGTTAKLDAISDRLMYRLQYRNFGTHETLVTNHTVDVNGADRAGVRWYELRRTGSSWSIYQQSTYSPSSAHRWMASVAMNGLGQIALGYSISDVGANLYPAISYTGRLATDALNTMTQGETIMHAGDGSQTSSSSRWGDYSMMAVDPTDDCTFWYTNEYYSATSSSGWRTRIGSFKLPGCETPPACQTAADCNDSDECTTDACVGGQCQHTAVNCNDNDACTTDSCNPATGCVNAPVVCNDNNLCTTDTCNPATGCVFTPVNCNDNNACTTDSCNPATGACVNTPVTCNDSNPCTDDACDAVAGCVYTNNTASCNDGNACTSGDTCSGGTCQGTPVSCDDSNACTADSCDPATGCANTTINCDDNNPCTDDSCDAVAGCVHTNNAAPCSDGNACTSGDACSGGACQGTPVTCNDGDLCTTDSCNPASGCVFTPVTCNDGNPCTADSCDSASGACTSMPVADGTSCPGGTCQNGTCVANCTTYTGSVSASVKNSHHELGTLSNVVISGALDCPGQSGKDIDLYLQRQTSFGWSTVASSYGWTCVENVTYNAGATAYKYRWRVRWYSGTGTISYTLLSCK